MTANAQKNQRKPARVKRRPAPRPDAIAYRLDELQELGGPGRTRAYELAAQGKLRMIKVGGRTLVSGDSLRDLLTNGCE